MMPKKAIRSAETRQSEAILSAVAFAASRLLGSGSIRANIDVVLHRLGEAVPADRVTVFKIDRTGAKADRARLWSEWVCASPQSQTVQPGRDDRALDQPVLKEWSRLLRRGELIEGSVEDLSDGPRQLSKSHGETFLSAPIFQAGDWWGFLSVSDSLEHRRWSNSERDGLRAVAAVLSAALDRERSSRGTGGDIRGRREAAARIRTQEKVKRTILDHLPAMVGVVGSDGSMEWVNQPWQQTLGYTLEQAQSGEALQRMYPDPDALDRVRRWIEDTDATWGTFQTRTADGRSLHTEWSNVRLPDGRSVGIGLDVTERLRAEEAVRVSERRHRLLFETMQQGVVYQAADGQIVEANPAAERILGLTLDQMQGRTSTDPRWRALREDGSEFPGDEHPSMVALKTGRVVRNEIMGVFHPDAGEHRWILIHAIPQFREGESRPYQVYTSFTDITELRRVQEVLQVREAEYRFQAQLLDAVGQSVVAADMKGRITYANRFAGELYRCGEEDLLGRPITDLVGPDDQARVAALIERADHEDQWNGEITLKRMDRSTFTAHCTGRLVRSPDGGALQIITTASDISKRKELEQQLRQAQKMEAVGRLAGGIAHDFNNLLAVINGNADLCFQDLEVDHPAREGMLEIAEAAEQAADLTRQLLAFSRKQMLQPRILELKTALGGMTSLLRRVLGEDIVFEVRHDEGVGPVQADPAQLQQVLLNLAVNARDAMPAGGTLTIRTRMAELGKGKAASLELEPGAHVELSVTDTGCGMDQSTLARIYEPFFTTKAQGNGSGLGLSTVFGIVKQSGGGIDVESVLGTGTTFRIYLPVVLDRPVDEPQSRSTAPLRGGRETILVVEDEDAVRHLVERVLQRQGYDVLTAADAEKALATVATSHRKADLVLTDVVLPGMSGRELAERIREHWPQVRIIFTSGYSEDKLRSDHLRELDGDFLPKPFNIASLADRIRSSLDH